MVLLGAHVKIIKLGNLINETVDLLKCLSN